MNKLEEKQPFFDKNTTLVIKGLAILLMTAHHFLFYPEFWLEDVSYPILKSLAPIMESPTKLCVSIFCFLTGYFYFYNKNKNFKYSLKKITDVLVSYWIVFIVFAIIAITSVHYEYNLVDFIAELFALKRPTMYFCWYIYFYIIVMLLLPLISRAMSKNIFIDLFITVILFDAIYRLIYMFDPFDSEANTIFLSVLKDVRIWIPNVFAGYIFASYDLFRKMFDLNMKLIKNKYFNVIIWLILVCITPMGRHLLSSFTLNLGGPFHFKIRLDIIYSPLYIYSVACLCRELNIKPIKLVLMKLGEQSLLMWFVSCIFFNNCKTVFQPILYYPKNEIVVFIWALILCYVPSILLDKLVKILKNYKNKLLFNE